MPLMDYYLIYINEVIHIKIKSLNTFSGSSLCFVNGDINYLYEIVNEVKKEININDVYEIFPEKGNIKIDDIRKMQEFLEYKPNFSSYKLVVIHEIDKMNQQAANAILKILEEPPTFAVMLSTTTKWYNLLPTIRSRLYKILIPNSDIGKKIKEKNEKIYIEFSYSINSNYKLAKYIFDNIDNESKLIEMINSLKGLKNLELVEIILSEDEDTEKELLKYEAFFELIKRFENLDLIEIQSVIDKIISKKNSIANKLDTIKLFARLFLSLYHDAYVYRLSSYWKEFSSLKMYEFFGFSNFKLNFENIYENIKWCDNLTRLNISNLNFDLVITTMFFRFLHAFFSDKEE
ncbi:hypothetical protein XO10_04040 [Marinitoga sp. 1135]|uniref:hypothetical protein n=2 Tax=Marinitoga TaxID=160798 RepID=UPI00095080B9|nr:hypothetical protein [Marinitoga sp. 1138]APT75721.1 hypothetical protein LN42_04475 [Marinitoga sp. 1137]NUU95458.1 hypothetical protein [Marinitoga sp. 1135]